MVTLFSRVDEGIVDFQFIHFEIDFIPFVSDYLFGDVKHWFCTNENKHPGDVRVSV